MIVTDASVILELLLRTPVAERIESQLFDAGETLDAPHLLDLELAQVLRRCAGTRYTIATVRCRRYTKACYWITRFPASIVLELLPTTTSAER
ncbi:MAG TPA: hypothetical protein VGJ18_25630 [Gemmatimonadaceae bacterium]|jgi:predicted nucleic acid-binding protein